MELEDESSHQIPWQGFLHIDDNKSKMFSFLALNVESTNTTKQIITSQDVSGLVQCAHEEVNLGSTCT